MNWILAIDQSLFTFINIDLTNSVFDNFFPFITDLHKNIYFVSIVYPLILYALVKRYSKKGFLIFFMCALSLGTIDLVGNHGFKKTVQRLRPGDNPAVHSIVRSPYGGFSFVSNHAANIFGFALFMGFFLPYLRYLFFTIAFLIGFSRVYNGVHYPTDVICGALLGLLISYGYIKIYTRFFSQPKVAAA